MKGWGFDVHLRHTALTQRSHVVSLRRNGKIYLKQIHWEIPYRVQRYYTVGPMKWALEAYIDRRKQCG